MQFSFFNGQIERLRNVYSPASLNEERVKVIWERFKHVDGYKFAEALNLLIGEFTTQALPSLSKMSEAVAAVRGAKDAISKMQDLQPVHFCEPCRDFGFVFEGDLLVRCKRCENGMAISEESLAHHQKCYDRGRQVFIRKDFTSALQALPYDPNQRGEIPKHDPIDRSGEWR